MTPKGYKELTTRQKRRLLEEMHPAITFNEANGGHYQGGESFPISLEEVVEQINRRKLTINDAGSP